eukprot:SAG11_NODE_81_length_17673_cov_7.702572_14_plen_93_part_00
MHAVERNSDNVSSIELVSSDEHNKLAKRLMSRHVFGRGVSSQEEAWVLTVSQMSMVHSWSLIIISDQMVRGTKTSSIWKLINMKDQENNRHT